MFVTKGCDNSEDFDSSMLICQISILWQCIKMLVIPIKIINNIVNVVYCVLKSMCIGV